MTALVKTAMNGIAGEIHAPVDGKRFALIVAYLSAFVAGAALVELDYVQKIGLGQLAEIGFAATCLVAVATVLHVLGHVSTNRLAISRVAFQSGIAVLVGAAAATVLNQTVMGVTGVLAGVILGAATRASLDRVDVSRLRTLFTGGGAVAAYLVFLISILHTAVTVGF